MFIWILVEQVFHKSGNYDWREGILLENNAFRMIMFIGAVIVVGSIIQLITANYEQIKILIEQYFSYKLQKY